MQSFGWLLLFAVVGFIFNATLCWKFIQGYRRARIGVRTPYYFALMWFTNNSWFPPPANGGPRLASCMVPIGILLINSVFFGLGCLKMVLAALLDDWH